MTQKDNATNFKQLNVVEVDDSTKTVKFMFGGAISGEYEIWIRHTTQGLIGSSGIALLVESKVTNVVPKTGSIYGGTVLTITGTNFGTVKTDNPVNIY